MKKIFTLCMLMMAFGFYTIAQNNQNPKTTKTTSTTKTTTTTQTKTKVEKTPEQKAQKIADDMTTKLTLNDDQKKKVYDAELASIQKMDELKKTDATDKAKLGKDRKAQKDDLESKIKEILTADQYKKFHEKPGTKETPKTKTETTTKPATKK